MLNTKCNNQPTAIGAPIISANIAGGFIFGMPIYGAAYMINLITMVAIIPAMMIGLI